MAFNFKKKFDPTVSIYLFVIFALLVIVFIVSSKVIFRPWTARTYAAAAMLDSRVFMFGGVDRNGECRDEIIMIDIENLKLHRVGKLPKPAYSGAADVKGGMIYFAGGLSGKQYLDEVYSYDPQRETLNLIGRLPGPRAFGSLSVQGDYLYYFGGFDGNRLRSEIVEITPETGDSRIVAELPEPLEYHRSVTAGSLIYIIGGENEQHENMATVFAYSPVDNSLVELNELSGPVVRFAAMVALQSGSEDEIIIAGGWGGSQLNSFTRLKLQGGTYTEQFMGVLPEPFSDVELFEYDDNLYLVGGINPDFNRQIRLLRIKPGTMECEDLHLKSFAWR